MKQSINYLSIMLDSLRKKIAVLDDILAINRRQAELIVDIKKNMVAYEASLDEKQQLIDSLNELDEGFENLYGRIQEELLVNREQYKEEITEMKKLIAHITDKSVEIQRTEEKNRQVISHQFAMIRKEVKDFKDNNKAASQYYSNMQKLSYVSPQFMDQKK